MVLDAIDEPIVLAPLAGGPSTPALAAAVSNAGGLGFLGSGYLTAEQTREAIAATRSLTAAPFGVNVFFPSPEPAPPAAYGPYVERLRAWAAARGAVLGEARYGDDAYAEKLELLMADPVAVVSFTFGCPDAPAVARLRTAGTEVWVTVTCPEEAEHAASAGADVLVVQGSEAGGHRGSFTDEHGAPSYTLHALLQLVGARVATPLVASGAIATGGAIAAALSAGARAVQLGSAFLLCPEAGTSPAHREALRSDRPTAMTRAFTGRLARGIRNAFMDEHDEAAPLAYPEIHYVTAPLRKHAREVGDESVINLWAGEAHQLAREAPAGEIVRDLMRDARTAAAQASARLGA